MARIANQLSNPWLIITFSILRYLLALNISCNRISSFLRFFQQMLQCSQSRRMRPTNNIRNKRLTAHYCHTSQSFALFFCSLALICWSCWSFSCARSPILKHVALISKHVWNWHTYVFNTLTHPVCEHRRLHFSALTSYIRHLCVVLFYKLGFRSAFSWQIVICNHIRQNMHTNLNLRSNSLLFLSLRINFVCRSRNIYSYCGSSRLIYVSIIIFSILRIISIF